MQKYAVTVGGGRNHRFNLSDAAMLKDHHVDAGGGIKNAVAKLKSKLGHTTKIELEVRDLAELEAGGVKALTSVAVKEITPEGVSWQNPDGSIDFAGDDILVCSELLKELLAVI